MQSAQCCSFIKGRKDTAPFPALMSPTHSNESAAAQPAPATPHPPAPTPPKKTRMSPPPTAHPTRYQASADTAASKIVCSRMFIVFLLRIAPAHSMANPACITNTSAPAHSRKKVLMPSLIPLSWLVRLVVGSAGGGAWMEGWGSVGATIL